MPQARLSLMLLAASLALTAGCDPVDYIEVEPSFVTLANRKDSKWLVAKAKSHTGVHYPKKGINWTSKDPGVATVDEKGRIAPVKSGRTVIVATHGKVTASIPVEVKFAEKMTVTPSPLELTEGGESVELKVRVFDFEGRELKERTATFVSKNKEVVSMGQNAAFPVNAGESVVEVRVEDLLQSVPVKVAAEKRVAAKR